MCQGHELLHICLVLVRSDNLWSTFLLKGASVSLHDAFNCCKGLLKLSLSFAAIVRNDFTFVVRRCYHFELKVPCLIVYFMLRCEQGLSNGFNSIIARTSQREVNADFKGIHG